MKSNHSFSRRTPDLIAREIAVVLGGGEWFEFKGLFTVVYGNLRARKAAGGGEEMMRLRAYEKLQNLVGMGAVEKKGKEYRGVTAGLAAVLEATDGAAKPVVSAVKTVAGKAKAKSAAVQKPVASEGAPGSGIVLAA